MYLNEGPASVDKSRRRPALRHACFRHPVPVVDTESFFVGARWAMDNLLLHPGMVDVPPRAAVKLALEHLRGYVDEQERSWREGFRVEDESLEREVRRLEDMDFEE